MLSFPEASGLPSKLDVVRVKQDEAVGKVAVVREEVLRFSTELVALRSEVEALRVFSADPGIDEESSRVRHEVVRGELSALEERGGDGLSLGSISANTHASVIAEYLQSDIYWRHEEFEHSHNSQSRYVKALSDITLLFSGIDLSSLYQTP
ncbi:hypothetical protein ACLOJK_036897 [Asimina triloba]